MWTRSRLEALGPAPETATRRTQLDGLRGIAVISIVILHCLEPIDLHFLVASQRSWAVLSTGVQLFFVLSGFLLFLPFARTAILGSEAPSIHKYLVRRGRRILPAYWVSILIFVTLVQRPTGLHGGVDIVLHLLLIQNLLSSTYNGINGPFWTMAVEVQFYLLLPGLGALAQRALRSHRQRPAFLLIAAGILTAALISYGYSLLTSRFVRILHPFVFALSAFQFLPVFAIGMAASMIYVGTTEGCLPAESVRRWARLGGAVGIGMLLLLTVLSQFLVQHDRYGYILMQQGAGPAYGAIVLAALLGYNSWGRWLSRPLLGFFAMVSYSMYIWNQVIDHWAGRFGQYLFQSQWGALGTTLTLGTLLTTVAASASYFLVERPGLGTGKAASFAARTHSSGGHLGNPTSRRPETYRTPQRME